MSDLDLLRALGDRIVPPPMDALRETARRRTRRATTLAAAGSAAAVAIVVVGATLLNARDNESIEPIHPIDGNSSRPLTYAVAADVHYGDQTVTAPAPVVELDVTDDGVVVRTEDGGIWFTDGADLEQIGTLGEPGAPYEAVAADHPYGATYGYVVSGNPGSRVAWFEFPRPGAPDLVVYDTSSREEVSRQAIDVPAGSGALLASATGRYGYWFVDPDFEDWEPQMRVDLATGVQERVGAKEYYADAPPVGTPRTMMVSNAEGNEPVVYLVNDAVGWQFDVGGGRLEPQGPQPLDARDGGTGQPFNFAAPADYPNTAPNWLSQWLDDDTVVVTVTRGGHDDLFECHFSTRGCTVALRVPAEAVMPGIG